MTVRTILPLIILVGLILLFVTPVAAGDNNAPPESVTLTPTPEQPLSHPDVNETGLPEEESDTPLHILDGTENAPAGSGSHEDVSGTIDNPYNSEYLPDNSPAESVNSETGPEQS